MKKDNYIAVIQAGGKGTRMVSITKDIIPKPMIELNDKPMLLWQMEKIAEYGIKDFIIIVGHLGGVIEDYFGDGSDFGYSISYIYEKELLGSAGSLYYLKEMNVKKDILFIFGDIIFEIDFDRMFAFHEQNNSFITLLAHPNSHPYDSDLLVLDNNCIVKQIDSKNNNRDYWYKNCVNAGIYILNNKVLMDFDFPQKKDFEKDILNKHITDNCVYGYITPEYVKDAGTPERFYDVSEELTKGVSQKKCLKYKQLCVFLDRDGTLNKYKGLIYDEKDLVLEENAAEAIKLLNKNGIMAIVVTNQPVVARGLCSVEEVKNINNKLETLLGIEGAYLDDIVFCPHHPDKGFDGENVDYKIECNCRKPKTGLIDIMVNKYNIDKSNSYFVGDTTVDVQTGINAGLKTIMVNTGVAGKDLKFKNVPNEIASDILDAVRIILDGRV